MRRDAFVCVFHRSRRRRMDQRWRIGDRVEARYRAGTTPAVLLPTGEEGWYPGEVVNVHEDLPLNHASPVLPTVRRHPCPEYS